MKQFFLLCFGMILLLLLGVSCGDYQDETYTISALDAAACGVYEVDSLAISLRPAALPDTVVTFADRVAFLTEAGIVFGVDSDSLWSVRFPTDSLYMVFQVVNSGDKVIYTDHNVNFSLSDGDTTISPAEEAIELSTVAACPYIFSRRVYHLGAGSYLICLSSEDPVNFKMVVLNKE